MPWFDRSHVVTLIAVTLLPACGGPSLGFDASPRDGSVDAFDAPVDTRDVVDALDARDVVDALDAADATRDGAGADAVDAIDAVTSDVPVIPVHRSPLALSRGYPDGPGGHFTSSCALHDDGTVRCWGSNYRGQLGDGSGTDQSTPVVIPGLTGVVELAGGFTNYCARLMDGTVRCWGANDSGQIGDGTLTGRPTPVAVTGLHDAVGLAVGGDHSCALLADGTMMCWGANDAGELGARGPDTCNVLGYPYNCARTPVAVGGLRRVVEIAAGDGFTCARLATGSVSCWGYATFGEIGIVGPDHCSIGTSDFRCALTPQNIPALSGAVELALGQDHTCARMGDGSVLCSGRDDYGQLGDGLSDIRSGFLPVVGITGAVSLTSGANHLCVRLADGSVRCWGDNTDGQIPSAPESCTYIGGPPFQCHRTPAEVPAFAGYPEVMPGLNQTCARDPRGATYCVGGNSHGQLGDGTQVNQPAPVAVIGAP
jgi:alpha-tubulin suppressor-like RCC1 family protein